MPRNSPPNFFGSRIAARCVILGGADRASENRRRVNLRSPGRNGKTANLADNGPAIA